MISPLFIRMSLPLLTLVNPFSSVNWDMEELCYKKKDAIAEKNLLRVRMAVDQITVSYGDYVH